jgi:aspartyl-tRNA(Asn)/glutamyl-tRNA(Gln) amidotransferase subunit C
MPAVDEKAVTHVARLARLTLTPAETSQFAIELTKILELVAQLDEPDLSNIVLDAHIAQPAVLRPDVAVQTINLDSLLANAPRPEGHYFQVPKILES